MLSRWRVLPSFHNSAAVVVHLQVSAEQVGAFCPHSLTLMLWSLGRVGYNPGREWVRTLLGRTARWVCACV